MEYIILLFIVIIVFWVYSGQKLKAVIKKFEGVPELADQYITELYSIKTKEGGIFYAVPIQTWQAALNVASAITISGFIEMTSYSEPTKDRLGRNAYNYVINKYDCLNLYTELAGIIEGYKNSYTIPFLHAINPKLAEDGHWVKSLVEGWIFKFFFGRQHTEKDKNAMHDIAVIHDALLNAIHSFMWSKP